MTNDARGNYYFHDENIWSDDIHHLKSNSIIKRWKIEDKSDTGTWEFKGPQRLGARNHEQQQQTPPSGVFVDLGLDDSQPNGKHHSPKNAHNMEIGKGPSRPSLGD